MGTRISSGFTIIETMLFLAVTGLLLMGALIGVGNSLNAQRYQDAVETFKSVLQGQYAELGSVKNNRDNTWGCGNDARAVPEGGQIRGQSNCVIIGRYMTINGEDITVYPVLAYQRSSAEGSNDVDDLRTRFTYNIDSSDITTMKMEWGTRVAWPVEGSGSRPAGTPRSIAILFIRSPLSGLIYTFSSDSVPSSAAAIKSDTFTAMMQAGNTIPGQGNRTICVASDNLFVGGDRAIVIAYGASSATAIEVRPNSVVPAGGAKC